MPGCSWKVTKLLVDQGTVYLKEATMEHYGPNEADQAANEKFDREFEEMQNQKALFDAKYPNSSVYWSLNYDCKLGDVAVEGKVKFQDWNGEFISEVFNDPTWEHVACVAEIAMAVTGDNHHCYLEGIYREKEAESDVKTYVLSMGS